MSMYKMPSSARHCFSPKNDFKGAVPIISHIRRNVWMVGFRLGVVAGTIAVWRVLCTDSTLLIKEVEGIVTI